MTTATATKADPLAQLEQLEQTHAEAKAEADKIGREAYAKQRRASELTEERRRLVHRSPGLVDHRDQPLASIKSNPIAAIDAEIEKLGDLADEAAKAAHAGRLAARAEADIRGHVSEHFAAIVAAELPTREAEAEDVRNLAASLIAGLDRYVGGNQRSTHLCHLVGDQGRSLPRTDHASALRKTLLDWATDAPAVMAPPR